MPKQIKSTRRSAYRLIFSVTYKAGIDFKASSSHSTVEQRTRVTLDDEPSKRDRAVARFPQSSLCVPCGK